jgi:outer membrane protein W
VGNFVGNDSFGIASHFLVRVNHASVTPDAESLYRAAHGTSQKRDVHRRTADAMQLSGRQIPHDNTPFELLCNDRDARQQQYEKP